MSMNQIPTMVLGIGGIGCRIAATVSDSLSKEDRKYVSIVGIDTNVNDLAKLKDRQMVLIQTSEDKEVSEYLEEHPDYLEWFPDNDFLRERTMTDGAGQIRTLSRLAFLASEENRSFEPILHEITRIRKVDDNPNNTSLTIMIVGSITGGTGAGLFLSLPFYLRKLIKTQAGIKRCVIRGMFVGPDILEEVQPSKTNKDAVCVNGYACLKELNAFYLQRAKQKKLVNNLRLEFYDHRDRSVNNIPYNYIYLVEKSGNLGTMGDARVNEIINYISHVVFVLMFSPVTPDALSVEDNFILKSIEEGGMNCYAGAGMCTLQYPLKTAQEYVTLAVVRDLVQKEWLLIDQEFNALKKAALSKQATDGTVETPEIKTSYVELFEKETQGDHGKLGKFLQEAYVEQDNKYISRATEFISALDSMVEDLLDSDDVKVKEGECRIDDQKMKKFSDAEIEINNVWEGMRRYSQYAKNLIATKPNGFADSLFPASKEVMDFHKDNPECIYQLLATVHPVTARFLIYDIINRLEAKIAELKPEITGIDLSAYSDEDFDPKSEGIQGPIETLGLIRDKRHPIWKILGPIGDVFNSEEKALIKLKRRLRDVSETHISTTHDYIENSIKYTVSQLVLERMIQLADNYAVFFSTVADKISRNNENIERLENLRFPFGQDGIYCSREAFREMALDFITGQSMELSDSTKTAIFEQIYLVQSRSFTLAGAAETKAAKERRMKDNAKKLESVFDTAVIETVRVSVIEHGTGIVNLTARNALIKEFELVEQKTKEDAGYNSALSDYIRKRIATALKVATPMLTTGGKGEAAGMTFIAVSPACSATDPELNPDTSETAKYYLLNTAPDTTVIINDEFEDTNISCMRLRYNITLEDLTKYKEGSRNAEAYKDRILNLGIKQVLNYNPDELLVVINPHLNCHWHEEGFIPSIEEKKRTQDHIDNLKAFIYAMGLDSFKMIPDDEHPDENGKPRPTWFAYTGSYTQAEPIKKCGKIIGNGYSDVYDALFYNRMLRIAILRDAQNITEKMKGYYTTEELYENILENWFVEDLIHPADSTDTSDLNIFDIFLSMRTHIPNEEWIELFNGLILTLWEFCETLFDGSEVYVNYAVRTILNEIYRNCMAGRKEAAVHQTGERLLTDQYSILLKKSYKKS